MRTYGNDDIKVTFGSTKQGAEAKGGSIVKLDDKGNFVEAHSYGNFVERVKGGLKVTRPDGATITMIDGGMTIRNLVPKSVGVRDLCEIKSFTVRTVGQVRICRTDFVDGGHVEVTYSQDNQVLAVAGQNIAKTLTKDDEIIVSQGVSASGHVQ
ncbi:hypothetical protein CES87_21315 [Pseudomonas sp. ERMR1:02]|nr:hypothetical protein CES87_21315 [Pseudomonas sp. ERMR1:02]